MGYTIYITRNALTEEEVAPAVRYLEANYNPKILRNDGGGYFNAVRDVACETLVIEAGVKSAYVKTNRNEPEDTEIKQLLIGVQEVLNDALEITCDDGFVYTSKGIQKGR